MEKSPTGSRSCCQRLLKPVRNGWLVPRFLELPLPVSLVRGCVSLVRRFAVVLLCCAAALLYGQDVGGAIELRIQSGIFFIDQDFEIEAVISRDAPQLKRSTSVPSFVLEGDTDAVQLLQSTAMPERDGLHVRCRYRFRQTGAFSFLPVLQWKRQRVELKPLSIIVHEPQLSDRTDFVWKLYTHAGALLPEDESAEQGQSYLLCLTAAFYTPGYDARYSEYIRTAAEPRSGTGSQPFASAVLPLPAEILRIDCPAVENAAVDPVGADIPLLAAAGRTGEPGTVPLTAASGGTGEAALVPLTAGRSEAETAGISRETYTLAAFRWVPLYPGMQELPQAHIVFAAGSTAVSRSRTQQVTPVGTVAACIQHMGMEDTGVFPYAAFTEAEPDLAQNASELSVQEEIRSAHRIAALRCRERTALFAFSARQERKRLEASLGIIRPLPLYPAVLGVIAGAAALCLAAVAVRLKCCGKKSWLLLLIFALCGAGSAAGLFHQTRRLQGVCITSGTRAAVRRIPEAAGSIVYRLAVGESVVIVRKTALWWYVKTAGGVTGWILQPSLAVCSKV